MYSLIPLRDGQEICRKSDYEYTDISFNKRKILKTILYSQFVPLATINYVRGML